MKKNEKNHIFVLAFFLCSFAIIACSKKSGDEAILPKQETVRTVLSSKKGISDELLAKVKQKFSHLKISRIQKGKIKSSSVRSNEFTYMGVQGFSDVTFDNPTTVTYSDTPFDVLFFEQPTGVSTLSSHYVLFAQDGLVGDMAMRIDIENQATGTPKIGLYTPDNELISEYEIIDGIYRNVVSGWPLAGRGYNAYMSRYKDCVGQYIQTMADMPLVGIMCLYFGRECAVSTLLICFASSLSFR